MNFFHVSIGGGITGIETVISIINQIKKNLKKKHTKKITLAIIEKNPENIPGGIAYGFERSKFGYFNNPLRLSPIKFKNWILKTNNKKKLIKYLNEFGGYSGKQWIKKNIKIFSSKSNKKHNELYVPRVMMNFWMMERFYSAMNEINNIYKMKKILIDIKFFKGEVCSLKKKKNFYQIKFKNKFCYELKYNRNYTNSNSVSFGKSIFFKEKLFAKNLNIGLGLPPPKQIATNAAIQNKNYIWDFYDEGSTNYLIQKILNLSKFKRKIIIYFIGYKAGLLEALPELLNLIINKKLNVKIICSSGKLQSIQKAELTISKKKYKTKFFKKILLSNINTAEKLYKSILSEFNFAKKNGYNNYDAWTYILKNDILFEVIKKFNKAQKIIYDSHFHEKIRSITRFTYPETIRSREIMLKKKILLAKKEEVKKVDLKNKNLLVITKNEKNILNKYKCDLVVNVSGPLNAEKIKTEVPLVNDLKKIGAKVMSGNFVVNNYFEIKELRNIYLPGILARGFNPERKTIISAILKNSNTVANQIYKKYLK